MPELNLLYVHAKHMKRRCTCEMRVVGDMTWLLVNRKCRQHG